MSDYKLYQIHYLQSVLEEDIPNLTMAAKKVIKSAVVEQLMIDPIGFGKPLRYSLNGHRRLRVCEYRIVYRVEVGAHLVIIIAIKNHRETHNIRNG
ncbi:type II toxin-antitoxin system RelE/ParE family toxin [Legionella sp. 27cVA30]|uniref:type II toxin-antitoxin system RelE family toxin n=1 Tax=Legionella TaxID=445 RepID=UPI000F8E20D4|nr:MULTISPECIES: type II toxin-antitoxin system RelE/ParE family toxin [Legionella]MCP0914655.1 type II toxin-antitoxin system RelE/ParE family toxin [Legionella sp. 27cVA30]RUR13333.1 type II toxin-antitoxin system RelE/ParE family toxin [Legionella septentrionalis]